MNHLKSIPFPHSPDKSVSSKQSGSSSQSFKPARELYLIFLKPNRKTRNPYTKQKTFLVSSLIFLKLGIVSKYINQVLSSLIQNWMHKKASKLSGKITKGNNSQKYWRISSKLNLVWQEFHDESFFSSLVHRYFVAFFKWKFDISFTRNKIYRDTPVPIVIHFKNFHYIKIYTVFVIIAAPRGAKNCKERFSSY